MYLCEDRKSAYGDKLPMYIVYPSLITYLWCLIRVTYSVTVSISTWTYINVCVFFSHCGMPSPLWLQCGNSRSQGPLECPGFSWILPHLSRCNCSLWPTLVDHKVLPLLFGCRWHSRGVGGVSWLIPSLALKPEFPHFCISMLCLSTDKILLMFLWIRTPCLITCDYQGKGLAWFIGDISCRGICLNI